MNFVGGKFGTAQNVTYLRSIAVCDYYTPTLFYHHCNMPAGFTNRIPLELHFAVLIIGDERIASNSDYGCLDCHKIYSC